jgi:hypothetical protein
MSFFTKIILGTVLVLVAATAVILLARSREPARVEALLREAAGWAEQGDADRLAALVDDDYEDDAERTRRLIREHLRAHDYEKVDVREVGVTVTGDEANAKISVRLHSAAFPYPVPETFLVKLRKRESGWRVVRVERAEREAVIK